MLPSSGEKRIAVTVDKELENQEAQDENHPPWHLPLLAVAEPTKINATHDAKASKRAVGLYVLLIGGPNLTNDLAAVLILFQQHKFGCSCGVSGLGHRVLRDGHDSDSFRYLWFTDGTMREIVK